jgi:hypothetical protein
MHRVPTYRPTLAEALGGTPTKAEAKVLTAAKAGTAAELSPYGIRPEKPSAATKIRAGLIRFLMLGGDDQNPVHPRGVLIQGAWIADKLDMEACETQLDLELLACWFDAAPDFDYSHMGGLYLPGCRVPGLRGQGMRLEDNLHLCELTRGDDAPLAFLSEATVDITGATITGQLACNGGRFDGAGGTALDCGAATIGADVFLRNGFHATGEVNLKGATITGQLACTGGRFDGAGGRALNCDALTVGADVFLRDGFHATGGVNLVRARIEGNLRFTKARIEGAISLRSARVEEEFVWTQVNLSETDSVSKEGSVTGLIGRAVITVLDLTEATLGVLDDDAQSWHAVDKVRLSGLKYESVQSQMTLDDRMTLFRRAQKEGDFDPGPFTQYAQVLRRAGHRVDAARVSFLRERLLRKEERQEAWTRGGRKWRAFSLLMQIRDTAFQTLLGYGYRPVYALVWTSFVILYAGLFFGYVYALGQFAPNSDVILTSREWRSAVSHGCPIAWDESFPARQTEGCVMPLTLWTGDLSLGIQPANAAKDYETFGRWLYAADLFLPLDTIGQTEAWAPSKDRGWWGLAAYYARFPIQLLGWVITAMGAAVVTGLIGRKED